MKNEDIKLAELYKDIYGSAHASAEFKRKVRNMTQGKETIKRRSFKAAAIIAAAAVAIIGGTIVTAATHKTYIGQYTTAYINGEEVQARYGAWETTGTYIIEAEANHKTYTAYIHGEYNKDTMPIYFRDEGKYIIASTTPEQQLNLYEDIDKAPHAKIEAGCLFLDTSYLHKDEPTPDEPFAYNFEFSDRILLTYYDNQDGKEDGVLKYDSHDYATYVVTPEGFIAEAMRSRGTALNDNYYMTLWGLIWGEESWESFQDYENAYRDSDGTVVIP